MEEIDIQVQKDSSGEKTIYWLNVYAGGETEAIQISKAIAGRLIKLGVSHGS